MADLLDCCDLTYHHHLKNMVSLYNNAQQHIMCDQQRMVNVMESAANSLNARADKVDFLRTNAPSVPDNSPFHREFNSEFRCGPEVKQFQKYFDTKVYWDILNTSKITFCYNRHFSRT